MYNTAYRVGVDICMHLCHVSLFWGECPFLGDWEFRPLIQTASLQVSTPVAVLLVHVCVLKYH